MNELVGVVLQQLLSQWLKTDIIKNFSLFELFVKISKLTYNDTNRYEGLIKTIALIEENYSIPFLAVKVDSWINENDNNKFIYNTYSDLSNLLNIERNNYGYR